MSGLEVICAGLEVSWPPGDPVLDIPRLELAPGSITAAVGASGTGKSTLGHALAGLLPWLGASTRGTVQFGSESLHPGRARDWRGKRGRLVRWIPQDPTIAFTPTRPLLPQLLETGPGADPLNARLEEYLEAVGLEELNDPDGRRAFELSGGELQRAAAAAAFAAGPALVVADEPTAHLDPPRALALARIVSRLAAQSGTSLLWITHDLRLAAALADRIIHLAGGCITADGPPAEILDSATGAPLPLVQASRRLAAMS
jgi:peptide/nickel transport system ATP-binding protein